MNDAKKALPEKRGWFPSVAGVIGGVVPGLAALFNNVSSPFWVTWNVFVIVVAFGFAAANFVGLIVKWYRRRDQRNGDDLAGT